jgi:hypothetical protein
VVSPELVQVEELAAPPKVKYLFDKASVLRFCANATAVCGVILPIGD